MIILPLLYTILIIQIAKSFVQEGSTAIFKDPKIWVHGCSIAIITYLLSAQTII